MTDNRSRNDRARSQAVRGWMQDGVSASLHWLPVSARIDFKLALLCYNALKTGQPDYLRAVLKSYMPSRNLRSTDHGLLVINRHNLETARRRFSLAGPSVYNGLPLTVKQSPSVGIFKSALKTYLFDQDIV